MKSLFCLLACGYLVALIGCAALPDGISGYTPLKQIAPEDWVVRRAANITPPLMMGYAPFHDSAAPYLVVYIEGDGRAWLSRNRPAQDPTPGNPVGLKLASVTPADFDTAYIGRPCQFIEPDMAGCDQRLWTSHRYSAEIVEAMSRGIDQIKQREERPIVLVGYSGGGVIAALLAAKRSDVLGFITVAANMDTSHWTSLHRVSPLEGSEDPLVYGDQLRQIPQVHFVGGSDKTVPVSVVESYLQSIGLSASEVLVPIAEYDHGCCWEQDWQQHFLTALTMLDLYPIQ